MTTVIYTSTIYAMRPVLSNGNVFVCQQNKSSVYNAIGRVCQQTGHVTYTVNVHIKYIIMQSVRILNKTFSTEPLPVFEDVAGLNSEPLPFDRLVFISLDTLTTSGTGMPIFGGTFGLGNSNGDFGASSTRSDFCTNMVEPCNANVHLIMISRTG